MCVNVLYYMTVLNVLVSSEISAILQCRGWNHIKYPKIWVKMDIVLAIYWARSQLH
jgi:hypothetical protein